MQNSDTLSATQDDGVSVTQADREAAAANIKRRLVWQHRGEQPWMDASTASMRLGEQDDHDEVQAFARYRAALTTPAQPKSAPGVVAIEVLHGEANSHVFEDRLMLGDQCIAFADEPWSSRIAAALSVPTAPAQSDDRVKALEEVGYQLFMAGLERWTKVLYPKDEAEASLANSANAISAIRAVYALAPVHTPDTVQGGVRYRHKVRGTEYEVVMSDYRRDLAWKAGYKAARAGKPYTANNRQHGTIFYDDWCDGRNDGQRDREQGAQA